MSNKPYPGLVMYSKEWVEHCAPAVPTLFQPLVMELSEMFQVGDGRDAEIIYEIIEKWLWNIYDFDTKINKSSGLRGDPQ